MTTFVAESIVGGYPKSGQVLFDVSVGVESGQLHVVLGANGAGKTTLLRMLAGVLSSENGRITLDGADVSNMSVNDRVRSGVTLVPQGRQLFPDLSVRENLTLGAYSSRRNISDRLDDVYGLFAVLRQKRDASAKSLSGGEQQMLAVGRGLMASPKVLLLDEPCIGIAPKFRYGLYETILSMARERGLAVLVCEQEISLAMTFAQSVTVLQQGRVVLQGVAEALNDQTSELRTAYLGL